MEFSGFRGHAASWNDTSFSLRMPVNSDSPTSLRARDLQPWVGLGPAFLHPRLDTSGPIGDSDPGNQSEQNAAVVSGLAGKSPGDPLRPHLHGVLEAELTRIRASRLGRL